MRGGSARDKYGHEHSVNVQRGPIVYNQSTHETIAMGGHVQCRKPTNPKVSIPYKGGLCDATGHLPGYIEQINCGPSSTNCCRKSGHSAQSEWEKKRLGRIYLYEWESL